MYLNSTYYIENTLKIIQLYYIITVIYLHGLYFDFSNKTPKCELYNGVGEISKSFWHFCPKWNWNIMLFHIVLRWKILYLILSIIIFRAIDIASLKNIIFEINKIIRGAGNAPVRVIHRVKKITNLKGYGLYTGNNDIWWALLFFNHPVKYKYGE